jgi:hypothetical protein
MSSFFAFGHRRHDLLVSEVRVPDRGDNIDGLDAEVPLRPADRSPRSDDVGVHRILFRCARWVRCLLGMQDGSKRVEKTGINYQTR